MHKDFFFIYFQILKNSVINRIGFSNLNENWQQSSVLLAERLVTLGIMEAQLWTLWNLMITTTIWYRGVQWGPSNCWEASVSRTVYCRFARLEKITSAVQETIVTRHNGSSIKCLPQTPQYDSVLMFWGVSGEPWIRRPWFPEKLVSRTAMRLIAVIFPAW